MHYLDSTLLDAHTDALNHCVGLVLVGMIALLEAYTEELAERLPESCAKRPQERLDDVIAVLVGLAVDELDQHLALILGHLLHVLLD